MDWMGRPNGDSCWESGHQRSWGIVASSAPIRFEPVHRSRVRDRLRTTLSDNGADSSRSRWTRFSLGAGRFLRALGGSLGSRLRFLGGSSGGDGDGDVADEAGSGCTIAISSFGLGRAGTTGGGAIIESIYDEVGGDGNATSTVNTDKHSSALIL